MAILKALLGFWKNNKLTVANVPLTILLAVAEEMLEWEYKCPYTKVWKQTYISLYFILPAVTLLILSSFLRIYVFKPPTHEELKFCGSLNKCCNILIPSSFLTFIWIVIVLLDGRYIACACSSEARNKTQEDEQYDDRNAIISKIAGMVLLSLLVIFSCIYLFCCPKKRKQEDAKQEELQNLSVNASDTQIAPMEESHGEKEKPSSSADIDDMGT